MRRLLFACLLLLCASSAFAQTKPEDKTIAAKTAVPQKIDGYVPLYWDAANGRMWMEISRFNTELLYTGSLPAGIGSNPIGLDRGQLGEERIVSFERVGPKVLMIQPNYRYRAALGRKPGSSGGPRRRPSAFARKSKPSRRINR